MQNDPNVVQKTTTTQREVPHGATVDSKTGEAHVPNSETVDAGNLKVILEDTPANRNIFAKLLEDNGQHEEAARIMGKSYNPTFGRRAKNLVTKNVNYAGLTVAVVLGTVVFFTSRFLLKKLAQKMNWNILGNTVVSATSEEEMKREVKTTNFRRVPTAPMQPSATA